jgi:hypothetical protein
LKLVRFVAFLCALSPLAAKAAEPPPKGQSKDESDAERERKREQLRVGAFGGIGFPRPLSIEAMAKIDRTVGVGLEYSFLPKQTVYGVDATLWALDVDFRVFPFKSAGFFLGLAAGHQHLGVGTTTALTGPMGITAATWLVNPRMGFLTTWASGLTFGMDVGVQLPLNATFSSNLPTQFTVAQDITDVAHVLGNGALPTLDLLRLGLLM